MCYLQDLFTAQEARGNRVARAMIKAVAEEAHAQGTARCYWLTQEHNTAARPLYDKVAKYNGLISHDFQLPQTGC